MSRNPSPFNLNAFDERTNSGGQKKVGRIHSNFELQITNSIVELGRIRILWTFWIKFDLFKTKFDLLKALNGPQSGLKMLFLPKHVIFYKFRI